MTTPSLIDESLCLTNDKTIINKCTKIANKHSIDLQKCEWIQIMKGVLEYFWRPRDTIGPSQGYGKVRFLDVLKNEIYRFDEFEDLLLFYEDGFFELSAFLFENLPTLFHCGQLI